MRIPAGPCLSPQGRSRRGPGPSPEVWHRAGQAGGAPVARTTVGLRSQSPPAPVSCSVCECGRAPARSSPPVRPPSLLSATPARTPIASTAPSSGRWTSACLRTPRTAKVRCVPCAGPVPRYSWLLPRGEAWLTGLPALPLGFSQAAWVSWVRGPHPGLCLPEGVGFGGPRPATWSWAAPGLMPCLPCRLRA